MRIALTWVNYTHSRDVIARTDGITFDGRFSLALRTLATARTAALLLGFLLFCVGAFLCQKSLTICDRYLVIVGEDLRKGEKAMTVAAVVDEGRL